MRAGVVATVARVELTRRYRAILADDAKRLLYLFGGGFGLLFVVFALVGVRAAGATVATTPTPGMVTTAGGILAGFLVGIVVLEVFTVLQTGLLPPGAEPLLLAATHREVVVGYTVVEGVKLLVVAGVPGVLAAIAFGVGAGSLATVPLGIGTVLLVTLTATTAGLALGLLLKTAAARVSIVAKYRNLLAALGFLAYMVAIVTGNSGAVAARAVGVLGVTPVGWLGDLVLLWLHPGAAPLRAAAVVGGGLAATVLCVGVVAGVTARLWYESPIQAGGGARASRMGQLPHVDRVTSHVVRKAWLRARRSPVRLLYVVYPLIFLVGPLADVFQGGPVPAWTPVAITVAGAWATGAAVALNPLGDEMPVLPVTVTTPVTGRRFVGALWLASAVAGAPLTVLGTVVAGVGAGLDTPTLLTSCVIAVAVPALSPGLAAGVGARFPNVETTEVLGSIRTVPPSSFAFIAYSLGLVALTLPVWAVGPGPLRRAVAAVTGLSPAMAGGLAAALSIVLLAGGAGVSFRAATRSFDGYTVE